MNDEFPKKISDNGWYELSDGNTVRGEDAAREAESRLADEDLALATDPKHVADRDEAEREYEAGETTTLTDFEREVAVEEEGLDGQSCANCAQPATVVDKGRTVNTVYYCHRHLPVYLR